MALSQRTLKGLLTTLANRGQALSAQMKAVVEIATRATTDVSRVLGPVALLDDLYARGMMAGLAWTMRDADFPTLPLSFQRVLLHHAALWASLWGHATTLPVRDSAPTIEALRGGATFAAGVAVGVKVEQLVSAATLAGVSSADFWNTSADAQVSLGRLAGYDFALAEPVDDPMSNFTFALTTMAPRVPDTAAMLTKFTAVSSPHYVDASLKKGSAMRVATGMTLPQIAAQVLGDASQWHVIAQLNGLRAPYISEDPAAQLGQVVGNRTLAQPAPSGGTSLTLTDVTGLLVDQRLGLRLSDLWQWVSITQLNTQTNEVTVSPALTFAASLATIVTVHNPSYDVVGRVLQPGDYLALPVSASSPERGILLQKGAPVNEAGLYGVDVGTTAEGNLSVRNGDIATASGRPNLIQALAHRFQTPRGSLPYHPLYGSDLQRYLGTRLLPYLSFLGAIDARQTLLRDPRAHEVNNVTVAAQGDRMVIEAQVTTTQNETFPLRVNV